MPASAALWLSGLQAIRSTNDSRSPRAGVVVPTRVSRAPVLRWTSLSAAAISSRHASLWGEPIQPRRGGSCSAYEVLGV